MRAKAGEIVVELDAILASQLFNVNMGRFVDFQCSCGFAIRRKEELLTPDTPVICGSCGRQYIYLPDPVGDTCKFVPDRFAYKCESCQQEKFVDAHAIEKLPVVVCDCGAKAQVSKQYVLTKVESEPA